MDWLNKLQYFKEITNSTYRSISNKSGIPYTTVETLFKGGSKDPKLFTVHKIVQALGFTLNDLVGTGDNENILSEDEGFFLHTYNRLDQRGKELIETMLLHEKERIASAQKLTPLETYQAIFFDCPVSAGTGEYLDFTTATIIRLTEKPHRNTDYILRVSGDSMTPKFRNGDYVCVHKQDCIEYGEIGIFTYAGSVYMKEYTPEGLKSINPKYELFPGREDMKCHGKVLGRIKGKVIM